MQTNKETKTTVGYTKDEVIADLLDIAKRCVFLFDNETNYPENTMGYRLAKDAKEAINKTYEIISE